MGFGISHKDSQYRGGTQVADSNKGKIGGNFKKFLRRRNWGGQGDWLFVSCLLFSVCFVVVYIFLVVAL